jgi:hypothetical protein
MSNAHKLALTLALVGAAATACSDDPSGPRRTPHDPATAPRVAVDRFAPGFANLFDRTVVPGLPAPNAPIDFDQYPFITHGAGPDGQQVSYYNFDVLPDAPAPIYQLYREGEDMPVEGQLNIINVIPGDPGYNDFWRVIRVTVPGDYVANTVASLEEIEDAGYPMETTDVIVNCPVVPSGSTANLRLAGPAGLIQGWYREQVVFYFTFDERALEVTPQGRVPVAPIYVTFNINPGEPGGGPASGFLTEAGTEQTHNIVAALPEAADYSPLWNVVAYDNEDFGLVFDLPSAQAATILVPSLGLVNCPIVTIQ